MEFRSQEHKGEQGEEEEEDEEEESARGEDCVVQVTEGLD